MKKKATIQDIANALGISRNTVSKAINNSEGIAESTRNKILQKAIEMDYKQFSYVRAVFPGTVSHSTPDHPKTAPAYLGQIALLTTVFFSQSHFASLMLDKLQYELAGVGYTLNTHRVTAEDIQEKRLPVTFLPEQYAGIICFELFDRTYDEMLCDLDIPILFVDGPCKRDGKSLPADQLYMDNTNSVVYLVHEMLARGYRRIGWIGDYLHCQSFYERYTAFRTTMLMAGVPVNERHILQTQARSEISQLVESLDSPPEVFFCANDFIAVDAIQVLTAKGIVVPWDVKVCGFDDSPEAGLVTPSLTTVHIHTQIMAFSAAHLLISRIREPSLDYRTIYTETDPVFRNSTDLKG